MKAERREAFAPVVLILETQEEVDALAAVFAHRTLADIVLEMPHAMEALHPFEIPGRYRKYFDRFEKHFRKVDQ